MRLVVHTDFLGLALRPPFATGVPEIADQLLLLGVDRDRRLARRERFGHPVVDVVELRIAVGIVRSLARLAVGLQAVVELVQQLADKRAADFVAHVAQAPAELAQALACPQQRRLRVAPRLRLDQATQIVEQARIGLAHRLAPAARAANSCHIGRLAGAQFP